jgi:hypothetical protein
LSPRQPEASSDRIEPRNHPRPSIPHRLVDRAITERETLLCSYLSAILFVGLVLNATVGWWWADALAAIGIAALAAREGLEAWFGERDH